MRKIESNGLCRFLTDYVKVIEAELNRCIIILYEMYRDGVHDVSACSIFYVNKCTEKK